MNTRPIITRSIAVIALLAMFVAWRDSFRAMTSTNLVLGAPETGVRACMTSLNGSIRLYFERGVPPVAYWQIRVSLIPPPNSLKLYRWELSECNGYPDWPRFNWEAGDFGVFGGGIRGLRSPGHGSPAYAGIGFPDWVLFLLAVIVVARRLVWRLRFGAARVLIWLKRNTPMPPPGPRAAPPRTM